MAEIRIQRKRYRNVWPWLLGLAVLALLPLPFVVGDRDDRRPIRGVATRVDTTTLREATPPAGDTVAQPSAPGPAQPTAAGERPAALGTGDRRIATAGGSVAPPTPAPASPAASPTSFERFIATANTKASEREFLSFTAEGLRRLADELRALGASEAGVRAIRANADSLERISPRRAGHADYALAAFLAAVHELDVLRGRHAAPVDTGRLRAATWAIRPRQALRAQRGSVQRFFESARDALHALSRSPGANRRR